MRRLSQTVFLIITLAWFRGLLGSWPQDLFMGLHPIPVAAALFRLIVLPSLWFCLGFLLLTAIFGRFYCSHLCPVGFLQDLLSKLLRGKKKPLGEPGLGPLGRFLRNGLFFALAATLVMKLSFYGWLDHFSSAGRIYRGLLAPTASTLWLPIQNHFRQYPDLFLAGSPLQWNLPLIFSLLFIAALALGTLMRPRWFCSLICPSGYVYSLVSRFNRRAVRLSPGCVSCGLCAARCPSQAIVDGNIDAATCIHCQDCVQVCPAKVLGTRAAPVQAAESSPDSPPASPERRRLIASVAGIAGAAAGMASGVGAGLLLRKNPSRSSAPSASDGAPRKSLNPVLPPGAGSMDRFNQLCAGCGACAAACPTGVIRLAFFEQGLSRLGKPYLNYDASYCAFQCNRCGTQCPAGAIMRLPMEKRKLTCVGIASIDQKLCIPYLRGEDCGACAEHCPTGAISTSRRKGVLVPSVDPKYCIGCGVCQHACPVRPVRAIRIDGSQVQAFASKFTSTPQAGDEAEDFPF